MGVADFKEIPGYHWEYVDPCMKAVRFRVKDDWKDESIFGTQSRLFSDQSSDHILYITQKQTSLDEALGKVYGRICEAVGDTNAYHLYEGSNYSGFSIYENKEGSPACLKGTTSYYLDFLLSRSAAFENEMPEGGQFLSNRLDRVLAFPFESWRFYILARDKKALAYSYYIGPGNEQETAYYSPFWEMDSNTAVNYFFNSIELV